MNNNSSLNFSLFIMILKSASISIPLIILNVPAFLIGLISLVIFLPLIIGSETLLLFMFHIYNITRPILYIIALITTIGGKQDMVAIAFYIIMGLQVINMLKNIAYTFMSILSIKKD